MASSLAWTIPIPWPTVGAFGPMSSADVQLATLDERALVEACIAGRAGAFDLIVERHRRPVYQLCYRFVGNHEDASDLSQDVFLRADRGLGRFKGQSSLATWLYRIAVNVSLNKVSAKAPLAQEASRSTRGGSSTNARNRRATACCVRSAASACAEPSRSCRASSG